MALGTYLLWATLLIIWSMVWKGLALWKAGNRKEKVWFIVLFLVNTAGILEIIYLLTRKKRKQIQTIR